MFKSFLSPPEQMCDDKRHIGHVWFATWAFIGRLWEEENLEPGPSPQHTHPLWAIQSRSGIFIHSSSPFPGVLYKNYIMCKTLQGALKQETEKI